MVKQCRSFTFSNDFDEKSIVKNIECDKHETVLTLKIFILQK